MAQPRIRSLGAGLLCLRPLTMILLAAGLASCAPAKRDDLIKEVLKADPEFSAVLEKHRELSSRIETAKRELELKRTTIERNISQLRKDLAAAATSARAKTSEIKKRMEPDQQRLTMALSLSSEELRAKRIQRASLGRSIAQLRKALNRKDAVWTPEERVRQQAQVDEMLKDAARLDGEMTGLKQNVRLLKIKLLLIKL
ncbi:MAG: hypothetical protein HY353_01775 [Candidatus Omnitrophica bacterium]|nr:hypothetical protein [Candidatus Omnitrophota bacterium]